ncbi:(citrate (Pro-3S)-lyase) ligase (Citrate lyase synthetase) [Latilactobacillus fuchuensis]|uniref:[Citrate [pro-3S]-lyase] ligase n=2 Tax=Latilactobacillus fuchuensis TaxID=164393 RepID=A0A2N9DY95_9LACO|nr:[citrate (pro-3S)-lyase] ligase [Latilactobacillus fuchuensis]MCP8858122.1 [citrate (pro-3S)-lyase] ligase [Latilactobacillus fuchuensis]SPC40103.1 (citrate (Pro-3S)-lyase) ligase (Citrate lyase synthetase) [Latilactobacillus fuchuensis]
MMLKRIWLGLNQTETQQWQALLEQAGLAVDWQVDYTIGLFENKQLIATGSVYANIIKCVAVSNQQQSQNLLTQVVQALLDDLEANQQTHSFVYTKPGTADYFTALGFKAIVTTKQVIVLERGFPNLNDYRQQLRQAKQAGQRIGAIVLNANPLTIGHEHLIQTAVQASDHLYLFVVSEERSLFSAQERLAMVQQIANKYTNVTVLPTNQYLVSSMTFPNYFLKDRADQNLARVQAEVDATLFAKVIAPELAITTRWVGEEPLSPVTAIYNQQMAHVFGTAIQLQIMPRLAIAGQVVSATRVRTAIKAQDWSQVAQLVPKEIYPIVKGSIDDGIKTNRNGRHHGI